MSMHALRWPRQIFAFARKELAEVVRQPRLLVVMVLGPFAVMAAFGLGYRDEPPQLRTVFVMPEGSPFLEQVDDYADQIGQFVEYRGVTTDRDEAGRDLARGDIDVIVEFPEDPLGTVLGGERAVVNVIHTRLDPIDRTAITFVSSLAIDQINSELLAQIVTQGQGVGDTATGLIGGAKTSIGLLRSAVATGDAAGAQQAAAELDAQANGVAVAASLSGAVSTHLGAEGSGATELGEQLRASLIDVHNGLSSLESGDSATLDAELERLEQLLDEAGSAYAEALSVDPHVLVQPLDREVQLAVEEVTSVTDWYAPAAVMLMLQQFGVAFGAMAFVRERQLGIDEVYRIAPVGAVGSLVGKYVAYMIVGSLIGAALSALVVVGLDVPVTGSIGDLAIVMALTLFASIGLGFVISLASRSDAQAVQYTMIVLLASLFFSGFFLAVGQMSGPAAWVPVLLPVTGGMLLLRDVMLRGRELDPQVIGGLVVYGAVVFALAYAGLRHRVSPSNRGVRRLREAT